MNNNSILLLIAALLLGACGQIGPLYLPDQEPPIHVEEEDENE